MPDMVEDGRWIRGRATDGSVQSRHRPQSGKVRILWVCRKSWQSGRTVTATFWVEGRANVSARGTDAGVRRGLRVWRVPEF